MGGPENPVDEACTLVSRAVIAVWFGYLNLGAGRTGRLLNSHKALMTLFWWAAEVEYGDGWSSASGGMPARRARSRGVVPHEQRCLFLDDMELHRVKREQPPKNGNTLE